MRALGTPAAPAWCAAPPLHIIPAGVVAAHNTGTASQNTPACARAWQDHWCFGIPGGRDAHPSDVRPGLDGASALWDIPRSAWYALAHRRATVRVAAGGPGTGF